MDALELIKTDHQRLESLFDRFRSESGRQQQVLLFENIKQDLNSHTSMEETVFYPAFKNYPEFQEIIDRSYQEYGKVKDQLSKISALPDESPEFADKVKLLWQDVSKHLDEEENELFPMVRKLMKRAERERLGRHMQAAKEEGAAA